MTSRFTPPLRPGPLRRRVWWGGLAGLGVATTNRVVLSGPGVGGPPGGGVAAVRVFGASGRMLSGQPVAKTFTDPRLCTAIVDRLTFAAAIIETGTDSYRPAQTRARAEQAATVDPTPGASRRGMLQRPTAPDNRERVSHTSSPRSSAET